MIRWLTLVVLVLCLVGATAIWRSTDDAADAASDVAPAHDAGDSSTHDAGASRIRDTSASRIHDAGDSSTHDATPIDGLTQGGTVPVGFDRVGHSMQGYGSAAEWYGDYVYFAASTVLQVYHAPPGAAPELVHEVEVRDWIREMAVSGDTLFVAARGDGLLAFDLSADPARPILVDRVSGVIDVAGQGEVDAVFNGVDATGDLVAVARVNNVPKARGGVDALVYRYDRGSGELELVRAIGTEVRSKTAAEIPITVGLTEDGDGLYIGYGVLVGELAFVSLGDPEAPVLHGDLGAAFDIRAHGDVAFVASTGLCAAGADCSMLSRVRVSDGTLSEEPIISNPGSSAGMSVDVDGDILCFGTWSPGRYEDGNNLWVFDSLLAEQPRRRAAAGTPDWIFQLACRDVTTGPDLVYVADEWGGLEVWEAGESELTLDLDRGRVATGALSEGLWNDGSRVYSVKRGAGLWAFDASHLDSERPIVEWIDRSDPCCSCADCCPPETGPFPYPPAVFVSAGASSQGRVALFASDRNTAVEGDGYFMVFDEEPGGGFECVYSEPMPDPGGHMLRTVGEEIIFAPTAAGSVRAYQHCPGRSDQVRLVAQFDVPASEPLNQVTDVEVYGDYVFVAEVHKPLLSMPDRGQVHAYHWPVSGLAKCPDRPSPDEPVYLGSFAADVIALRLALDERRGQLIVGASSKPIFPARDGALLFYDLEAFDPTNPAALDAARSDRTVGQSDLWTRPNVHELLVDGDDLYVVDRDNGLYRYDLAGEEYVGFYPAHRGPESQAFVAELVRTPPGVVPLYHPVAAAVLPSGDVVVHEHNSGRASILAVPQRATDVYLPAAHQRHGIFTAMER